MIRYTGRLRHTLISRTSIFVLSIFRYGQDCLRNGSIYVYIYILYNYIYIIICYDILEACSLRLLDSLAFFSGNPSRDGLSQVSSWWALWCCKMPLSSRPQSPSFFAQSKQESATWKSWHRLICNVYCWSRCAHCNLSWSFMYDMQDMYASIIIYNPSLHAPPVPFRCLSFAGSGNPTTLVAGLFRFMDSPTQWGQYTATSKMQSH